MIPSSMAAAILLQDVSSGQQARAVSWSAVFCSWLPGDVRDIMRCFAWEVHPMRDRLRTRGVTATDSCTYCGGMEPNRHVLQDCRIARTFWVLVRRNTNIRCPVSLFRGRPHDRLSVLVTACGARVLWTARCRAAVQRRRTVPLFLLVHELRIAVINALQRELYALGARGFTDRWGSHPSINVSHGYTTLVGTAP